MYMNKKRLLPALLALALLLPALSAAASAVEVETYVNVAVGSPVYGDHAVYRAKSECVCAD